MRKNCLSSYKIISFVYFVCFVGSKKMNNNAVLVVGAGVAGMEASLILAHAGKKVYLVEKELYIGGNIIKYEEVFANMECATCMISPKQQEVLQQGNIELLTLGEIQDVQGTCGDFAVKVKKKARYVDLADCIGCGECFNACPVSVANDFEQGLGQRKAIYVPCPGTLPNVPRIDPEQCVRFKGEECQACQESCMFEAIKYDQQDEDIEIQVDAIILATGFQPQDPREIPQYGYEIDDVYTAFAFERMYASNGPTEGKILLKNGESPKSAAIIYGVGTENSITPSSISSMYSLKFFHYLKEKISDIHITEFYNELWVPGKAYQKFYEKMKATGAELIRAADIAVTADNGKKVITYRPEIGGEAKVTTDMVILGTPMKPNNDASELARIFGISLSEAGFFAKAEGELSYVVTSREGIFIAGCATGPKDIQESIAQSQAAAGRVLALYSHNSLD